MINLKQAREELLDRIINSEADTKANIKVVQFLVKQLKVVDDPFVFELMMAKLEITL